MQASRDPMCTTLTLHPPVLLQSGLGLEHLGLQVDMKIMSGRVGSTRWFGGARGGATGRRLDRDQGSGNCSWKFVLEICEEMKSVLFRVSIDNGHPSEASTARANCWLSPSGRPHNAGCAAYEEK